MVRDKVFNLKFVDGDPNGIRTYKSKLSFITAVFLPRGLLPRAKQIELPKRGIYYLLKCGSTGFQKLYVGKSMNVVSRLKNHDLEKDWWDVAVLFLSKEAESVTGDVLTTLEKIAIDRAHDALGSVLENKVDPQHIPLPDDESTACELYDEIDFIMRALGYPIGTEAGSNSDQPVTAKNRARKPIEPQVEQCGTPVSMTHGSITVNGIYGDGATNALTLLKGTPVDMVADIYDADKKTPRLRQELIDQGVLVVQPGGSRAILKDDVTFTSPKAAAQFVFGGSLNGRLCWKTAEGKSINEVWGSRRDN